MCIRDRVYSALTLCDEKEGVRSPSRKQLSALTGLPESIVSVATAGLVGAGWITKEGKGGMRCSASYRLLAEKNQCTETVSETERVSETQDIDIIKESTA